MTGKELTKALRSTSGRVSIPLEMANAWIYAVKSDLIHWAEKFGNKETGYHLSPEESGEGWFLEYSGGR